MLFSLRIPPLLHTIKQIYNVRENIPNEHMTIIRIQSIKYSLNKLHEIFIILIEYSSSIYVTDKKDNS